MQNSADTHAPASTAEHFSAPLSCQLPSACADYKTHKDFFDNLKFYYLTDKYLFVHAGINPELPLENQSERDLVYIRGKFIYSKHNLPQKIIFGHTEFDKPYIDEGKIGIDLGCGKYKDACLCGLILDESGNEEFIYSDRRIN